MARARYRLATNGKLSICIVMLLVIGAAVCRMALDLRAGCLGCDRSSAQRHVDTAYASPQLDLSHNSSSLEPRQAPWTDEYKEASKKGKKFIAWMKDPSSAGNKAIPKFTKHSDIEAHGWSRKQEIVDYSHVTDGVYKSMIQILGTDLSNGIKVRFDHDRDVGEYPATNGEYVNVFWPNHGIILANDNYGPAYQISQNKASRTPWKDARGKPLPLTPLHQYSDLISLEYQHLSSSSPLKFIFRRNIQNPKTQKIIDKALGHAKKARPWEDGDIFTPKDNPEGFAALLATPNTSGICWMLIQKFPGREVKSVRVWWDGKGVGYSPNLMVEIGDV